MSGSPPPEHPHQPQYAEESASLGQLLRFFLWLGVVAFGGPVAHISVMEREVVERRRWVTREHFLDLIGVTNLLPGPNSTEMTMHVGYVQRGVPGVWAAGAGFIVPAALITLAISWAYVEYGALPAVQNFLAGVYAVVVALVACRPGQAGASGTRPPGGLGCGGDRIGGGAAWWQRARRAGRWGDHRSRCLLPAGRTNSPRPAFVVAGRIRR